MKPIAPLVLTLLLALPAAAQEPAPLDLSVPVATATPWSVHPAGDVPADPPGTYYGDTSGTPGGDLARKLRPQRPGDDGSTQVWGSVSTGIGYSKGYGSSWSSSANLNASKAFGENRQNRATLSIDLSKGEGPGFYSRHPHDPGWDGPHWDASRSGWDAPPSRP